MLLHEQIDNISNRSQCNLTNINKCIQHLSTVSSIFFGFMLETIKIGDSVSDSHIESLVLPLSLRKNLKDEIESDSNESFNSENSEE